MSCRRYFSAVVALFVFTMFGVPWALSQTSLNLTSSGQIVDFMTGETPGSLSVVLAWVPGDDPPSLLALSGSAVSNVAAWSDPSFTLTTPGPIALAAMSPGVFAASSASLNQATLAATSDSGATVFFGDLSSLSFSQPLQGSNLVTMRATVQGAGAFAGTTLNLVGQIALAAGATISQVALSRVGTDLGGVIVPEPASLILFATGLLLLGLALDRRRKRLIAS